LKSLKREVLIREASFWVGTKEVGDNEGELIKLFQRVIGTANREAWCMSFIQFCVNKTDFLIGNELYSKLPLSEHCMTVWHKSPSECRFIDPQPGRVAIWQHGETQLGHAGIVEKIFDEALFSSIEGNTANADEMVRNGDGVYRRRRTTASSHKFKLLGFLDPWA
jgi:hypothetical protein